MNALATRLGMRAEVVPTAWPDLERDLLAARFDVILNTWTPHADMPVEIAATAPYQHWSLRIVVRRDDGRVRRVADLAGLRVGYLTDPPVANSLRAMGAGLDARFLPFADGNKLFAALGRRELDAGLFDSFFLTRAVRDHPGIRVVGEPLNRLGYHVAVRRADADLLRRIEAALRALLPSSEMAAIRRRWQESLPDDPPPVAGPD